MGRKITRDPNIVGYELELPIEGTNNTERVILTKHEAAMLIATEYDMIISNAEVDFRRKKNGELSLYLKAAGNLQSLRDERMLERIDEELYDEEGKPIMVPTKNGFKQQTRIKPKYEAKFGKGDRSPSKAKKQQSEAERREQKRKALAAYLEQLKQQKEQQQLQI